MLRNNVLLLLLSLCMMACTPRHDAQYYQLHPAALQQAISKCPQSPPSPLTCEQLLPIAASVNQLANQLRANPQDFGQQILNLQATIAGNESTGTPLTELKQRLAVVKWLESPVS